MHQGARVYYEPSAVAFTAAPARLIHLARQRACWARGMIEGIRSVKPCNQPRWLLRFRTAIDLLIPALDVAYALVWLPGLVLAATGRYWIVGPYTLAVLPLTLVVNAILYRFQRRRVFTCSGSGSGATPSASSGSCSPTRCRCPRSPWPATGRSSWDSAAAGSSLPLTRSAAGRGRRCRSDQEPSLRTRSVVGTQPVTNG